MAVKGFYDNPQEATVPANSDLLGIQTGTTLADMKKITYENLVKPLDTAKADKDTDAVAGHIAVFDADGNPVDGVNVPSDFEIISRKKTTWSTPTSDLNYSSEKLVKASLDAQEARIAENESDIATNISDIGDLEISDGLQDGRLDTLEGTGEGSVAKAIDDALIPIEERIESLEREVQPIGVLFEGMPSVVTGERTLGASTSTLRVNAGIMNTEPYPETDIRFKFPFTDIRNAKINANFEVQAWVDEPDFLEVDGILATRLPAIYVNDSLYDIRISKTPRVGYHLHPLHVDATTGLKREYVWIGSDKSSKVDGENKLTCKLLTPYYTNVREDTILRPYSQAVGTGWGQGDIALRDYMRVLLLVAGNSHNSQTVFGRGVCDLRYTASDAVTVETLTSNYVVVSDATGALYNVGEWVNLGTSVGTTGKFAQRKITLKEANYDTLGNTRITVDGAVFTSSVGNVLWHAPQLISDEDFVAMGNECGYIGTNGRVPVSFFGIWNLWGNIWEWCDGLFHVNLVPYYTYDPSKYSSIGASQPADLTQFTQHPTTMPASNGYCGQFAGTPAVPSTLTGGSDSAGMCDYFYTSTGYKALLVGGGLADGSTAGFFYWNVSSAPSSASWHFGSRLLGRP